MSFEWRLVVGLWDFWKLNFSSADLLIVWVFIHGFGFGLSCFFLFAAEIEGFLIFVPLEGYNGPKSFANWMWLVLCIRSIPWTVRMILSETHLIWIIPRLICSSQKWRSDSWRILDGSDNVFWDVVRCSVAKLQQFKSPNDAFYNIKFRFIPAIERLHNKACNDAASPFALQHKTNCY